jgi:hypothetical protein
LRPSSCLRRHFSLLPLLLSACSPLIHRIFCTNFAISLLLSPLPPLNSYTRHRMSHFGPCHHLQLTLVTRTYPGACFRLPRTVSLTPAPLRLTERPAHSSQRRSETSTHPVHTPLILPPTLLPPLARLAFPCQHHNCNGPTAHLQRVHLDLLPLASKIFIFASNLRWLVPFPSHSGSGLHRRPTLEQNK